ncbi:MAG: AAA family ATPase, partial [Methanobrevibacter sp.]|nr:AAA family ATPase [Methanobrevibacter sp.]
MIINKIQLKNFKSYADTEIDFQRGTNIIVGENGAGKSSILESISFVLFKKHAGVLNDLIKMDKNKDLNKKMSVTLEFQSDGVNYKVERERTKTSSNATLYIEDDGDKDFITIVSGDTEVTKEIQSILNMDADLFLNATYIIQGEIADLAGKVPSEKKKLISKLLGIDSLEKAWKNSLAILNKYNEKKIKIKTLVESNSNSDKELKDKKIKYHQLISEEYSLKNELKELKKLIEDKTNANKRMEKAKSEHEKLISKQYIENSRIEQLKIDRETSKKQLTDITNAEKEMERLKTEVNKLPIYEDFLNSYNKIKHLKEEQENFEKKLMDINKYNKILKTEESIYQEYKSLKKEIEYLNERKNEIDKKLQAIAKDSETKEELEKEINKDKQEIDDFTRLVHEKLSIEADDFPSLNKSLEESKTKIKNKIKVFEDKSSTNNQKISTLTEKIRVAKEDLNQLKKLADKCPLCKSEISLEKRNHLNNSYNDTVTENSQMIEDIKNDNKKTKSELELLSNKLNEVDEIIKQSKYHETKAENLIKNNEKKSKLEKGIISEKDDKLEFGKVSVKLNSKKERLKSIEEPNQKYMEAKSVLNALEKPFVITNELAKVIKTLDAEIKNIKKVRDKDIFLASNDDDEELKNKIKHLKKMNNEYQRLGGIVIAKDDVISQINSKNKLIDETSNKIKTISDELESSKFDETKYQQIHYILDSKNKKLIYDSSNLGKIKGEINQIEIDVKNLEEKLKDYEKNKEKLKNLDDYLRLLKDIRDLYNKDSIQKDLRARSKPLIEKYTAEFFKDFNFNYSDLELDDDYNISVFGNDGETKLDMVSGGERI